MDTNRKRISEWDRIMMAITFAEAGEHNTARELLEEKREEVRPDLRNRNEEHRPELRV